MTKFYLAARYSRRGELLSYKADLEALGHEVTSRWLLGNHQVDDAGLSTEAKAEERRRFAQEDWDDLIAAEVCILFSEVPRQTNSRGGRLVEFGIALGRDMETMVVGPAENVFCCLDWVTRFESWALFLCDPRFDQVMAERCRVCGCTDDDCSGCVERTGQPCRWVEPDLCSACAGEASAR